MTTLILSQSDVAELLPMRECMDLMERALNALAKGEAVLPLRQVLWLEGGNALALMPSHWGTEGIMGVKAISVFPGSLNTSYDAHQGVVLLFETENGRLLAIMDATEITAIRTAAVSGVATRLLAREDASVLAILGSGVQAHTHLKAMLEARPIQKVLVWSRTAENALRFCQRESESAGISMAAVATVEEAVSDADIVCAVTSSRVPVLQRSWLRKGVHINAVGAMGKSNRELDSDTIADSGFFVDRRESAVNEAGDFLIPQQEGRIGEKHIRAEIGEILSGLASGRRSPSEITVFKSLGLAIEDLASAQYIYNRAVETGKGISVHLGGVRHGAG